MLKELFKESDEKETTYRDENVQKVLQRWQLRNELLDDFTEGLEYGVVVDAGEVEAEEGKKRGGLRNYKNTESPNKLGQKPDALTPQDKSCLLTVRTKQYTDPNVSQWILVLH